MHKMKLVNAFVLIACVLSGIAAGETVPSQVMEAAQYGILDFFYTSPRAELAKCGIPEECSAEDIELGPPLKIMALNDSALKSNTNKSPSALVRDANMWYVPIIFKGDYVSILTVAFHENEWKAVSLGKASFSHEIQETLIQFPQYSGYDRYILKDYMLKSDFLIYYQNEKIYWYPFESARRALNLIKSDYQRSLPEFSELSKKVIQKLLQEEK